MIPTFRHAACAGVALFLLAALAPRPPGQKPPITLRLEAPKQPLKAGERLLLRLKVTNTSDRACYVPVSRGVFGENGLIYQLHVRDHRGQPAPPARRLVPKKGVVLLGDGSIPGDRLEPRKSLTDLVNVTSRYDLSRPGRYTIWIAERFGRGPRDFVKSNAVTVTVVK